MTSPVPEPTPADRAAARALAAARLSPAVQAAQRALQAAAADGYSAGALAGAAAVPGAAAALPPGLAVLYPDPHAAWSAWAPGHADAAALLGDGGFASLLDDAEITLAGITDTTLDLLGNALADGAARGSSVETIARALTAVLDDPDRAYRIAVTELARAVEVGAQGSYDASGVTEWDWVTSPDACELCDEEEASNPHEVGEDGPPLHPSCRCASAPRDPGP